MKHRQALPHISNYRHGMHAPLGFMLEGYFHQLAKLVPQSFLGCGAWRWVLTHRFDHLIHPNRSYLKVWGPGTGGLQGPAHGELPQAHAGRRLPDGGLPARRRHRQVRCHRNPRTLFRPQTRHHSRVHHSNTRRRRGLGQLVQYMYSRVLLFLYIGVKEVSICKFFLPLH